MKGVACLLTLLVAGTARAEPGVVDITVTGVRSAAGHVLVALCTRAEFLQPSCTYRGRVASAPGTVVVRLTGVPPGIYAAQAFQDENDNGKLDRTWLGMPEEGLGFSNDAKMRFGPPSFDAASVQVGPAGASITVPLHYY